MGDNPQELKRSNS